MQSFSHFYKKYKLVFWLAPIILAIFFFLRLYNLTIIPVFADEAIYIRWAQVMRAEPTLRFLPLSDGKQPLFMWLVIPFLELITDPLIAGRMVSVLGGLGTLAGIFLLTLLLFQKVKVALLASFLYAITPFAVFFDRLALVDSLLTCFGVWLLALGVLLVQNQRLDLAMITGMVLGGALLTKSPAIFFAILLPGMVLLLPPPRGSASAHPRGVLTALFKLLGLWIVVYFFAFGIYNILRLGPNFQMIALRNRDYIFSLNHFLTNPFDPLQFHLKEIWQWFGALLTWPVFLLGGLGILGGLKEKKRETILLLLWLTLPLLVQAEYAKVFTARYILFSVPFVLILGSLGILEILERLGKFKWLKGLVLLALIVWPLQIDLLFLTRPQDAPLPRRERSGYFEGWTAGYGIREAADYLKNEARKGKVLAGTEGFFGTLPDGLQIYLEKAPDITIIGVGYPISAVPESLTNALADNRVFLLVNDSRLNLTGKELERMRLVASYPKAVKPDGKQEKLLFYEILR